MKKNFLLQGSAIETWSNISLSFRETEMCHRSCTSLSYIQMTQGLNVQLNIFTLTGRPVSPVWPPPYEAQDVKEFNIPDRKCKRTEE